MGELVCFFRRVERICRMAWWAELTPFVVWWNLSRSDRLGGFGFGNLEELGCWLVGGGASSFRALFLNS